jgi:hypothetical protein
MCKTFYVIFIHNYIFLAFCVTLKIKSLFRPVLRRTVRKYGSQPDSQHCFYFIFAFPGKIRVYLHMFTQTQFVSGLWAKS